MFPVELPIELPQNIGKYWGTVYNDCGSCGSKQCDVFVIGTMDELKCSKCGNRLGLGFCIQTEPFNSPERN